MGSGYKLYYNGNDECKNGVGIMLDSELKEGMIEVNRVSDRVIWIKLELNGTVENVVSTYAPQTYQQWCTVWKRLK